ncbi:hypothetical protein [Planotetraspora kaengkrachanensis]|uniref:Uncharacterized protein n=1 Tax=Planotetraspora kaengkrachanensis TaxID=575193 RepID=A0A8J3PZP7_9ACTN|nr:hypothetical protein [Planotetraspora kaengkrachanensis]GIG83930.1 hypothetical protein Pka01_70570 [Planotetraspora kaengkrachanensis]
MSARGAGHPSGRFPGGSTGPDSGVRWTLPAMVIVLVGVVAGVVACFVMTRAADTYPLTHRQVDAHIVRVIGPPGGGRSVPAPGADVEVSWTGGDGAVHSGRTHVGPLPDLKGSVRVWADARERLDWGPPGNGTIILGSVLGGLAAASAAWSAGRLLRVGRRAWTARRAVAGWEREWKDITATGR